MRETRDAQLVVNHECHAHTPPRAGRGTLQSAVLAHSTCRPAQMAKRVRPSPPVPTPESAKAASRVAGGRARRPPQQARGQRRVAAILDAADALVAEGGVAAATMQAVAARARTSAGSLYHFFPDREALLDALADRYAGELRAIYDGAVPTDAAARPSADFVEQLVRPFVAFVVRRPAYLAVARATGRAAERGRMESALDAALAARIAAALAARAPGVAPAVWARKAAAAVAMADGVLTAALAAAHAQPVAVLVEELVEALGLYLGSARGADLTGEG